MQYSDNDFEVLERRLEWFAGPLVVAIFAAIIVAVLLSRSTGL